MGTILGRTLGTTVGGTQHTARSLVDLSWATNPVPGSSSDWVRRSLGLLGCFDVRATNVRATRGTLPLVHMGRTAEGLPGRRARPPGCLGRCPRVPDHQCDPGTLANPPVRGTRMGRRRQGVWLSR